MWTFFFHQQKDVGTGYCKGEREMDWRFRLFRLLRRFLFRRTPKRKTLSNGENGVHQVGRPFETDHVQHQLTLEDVAHAQDAQAAFDFADGQSDVDGRIPEMDPLLAGIAGRPVAQAAPQRLGLELATQSARRRMIDQLQLEVSDAGADRQGVLEDGHGRQVPHFDVERQRSRTRLAVLNR